MNRAILRRLEALEQKAPQDTGKWHTIIVASDEEEERQTATLKASPKWTEGDNLMVIRLVAVGTEATPNETSACELSP
jgi:DNA-binding transcriptional regulator PaaX